MSIAIAAISGGVSDCAEVALDEQGRHADANRSESRPRSHQQRLADLERLPPSV